MTIVLAPQDIEAFRALLATRLGLHLDASHDADLASCLRERIDATGASVARYLQQLAASSVPEELSAIASQLTVGETYFFRNPNHFRALAAVASERAQRGAGLRLLSAGCASGEEAYTMAMVLSTALPAEAFERLEIEAIDVNPAVLEKARRGRYSAWSMRATPKEEEDRWFSRQGAELILRTDLRERVRIEERNLLESDPALWPPGRFDIIFCRNVLIYFSPEALRATVNRFARSLSPGGFLFLGDAENLRGVSHDFRLHHTHDTFYYQLRDDQAAPPANDRARFAAPMTPVTPLPLPDDSWIQEIQDAAERIARLTREPLLEPSHTPPAVSRHEVSIAEVMLLMKREQYKDAIDVLGHLPEGAGSDVQLLRATLLLNAGQVGEAQNAAMQLLVHDELDAGAHYVLALCREHAGDLAAAAQHDETATYLDPSFAMPRFHLGRLARRRGDLSTARADLQRAADLLARDDAARILLFGGGFEREALVQVCRAELTACGGA